MPDRNFNPRIPAGSDNEARRFIDTHNLLYPARRPMPISVLNQRAASKGWHRPHNNKYEVDPTYAYDDGSVIHIQSSHALVATGIRLPSAPTGALATACPGWWVANQRVPAQTIVSGNDVWNVPQWPLPVPSNVDDPLNFWVPYLGDIA